METDSQDQHAAFSAAEALRGAIPRGEIRVIFVRHGETEANKRGILQGQSEWPLSTLGRTQAAAVGRALRAESFDHVYCSDLGRCRDTLAAILADHGGGTTRAAPFFDPNLREMALGPLEGKPRGTVLGTLGAGAAGADTACAHPMETSDDVVRRAARFWARLLQECAGDARATCVGAGATAGGAAVLVVSHGGFLHALLNRVLDIRQDGALGNCSLTVLRLQSGFEQPRPVVLNATAHLRELHAAKHA